MDQHLVDNMADEQPHWIETKRAIEYIPGEIFSRSHIPLARLESVE